MSKSGGPGRPAPGSSGSASPPTVEIPVALRNGQSNGYANGHSHNGHSNQPAAQEHQLSGQSRASQPPQPPQSPTAEPPPRDLRAPAILVATVVGLLVAGAGLGAGYHALKPPRYTATLAEIVTTSSASLLDPTADATPESRDVTTNVDLLSSGLVEDRADLVAGTRLPRLQVNSRSDSNVVTAAADGPTRAAAGRAVTAYVTAYEALLSAQQKAVLEGEQSRLLALQRQYRAQVAALDKQLNDASAARKQVLVQSQSPRRQSLAESADDAATRLSRVGETLTRLPATTQRLDPTPVTKAAGTSLPMDAATGVVLGAIAAGFVLWRRFRPRFS